VVGKNMKIALVCIAKNEEDYIQEWIDYNKKIGFDDIFIYQNDWRWTGSTENVHKLIIDGKNIQTKAYNTFYHTKGKEYDWIAFFDIDEFLVLKKHKTIQDFVNDYSEYNSIGINWVLFGDNGYEKLNDETSVIRRFTKRQKGVNLHVKSIVKTKLNLNMTVHTPSIPWIDTDKNFRFGFFNKDGNDNIAQINHYFCKTKEEFIKKIERGRADSLHVVRTIEEFEPHNTNEIEDLLAVNFMYPELLLTN